MYHDFSELPYKAAVEGEKGVHHRETWQILFWGMRLSSLKLRTAIMEHSVKAQWGKIGSN